MNASRHVLGMRVDATSYGDATERIMTWAAAGRSAYVCIANVHMTMEAHDDPSFRSVVNDANLVTPDGMPLAWALRLMGIGGQPRVRGPDLVPIVALEAARRGVPIAVYGGRPEVADRFAEALRRLAPGLDVVDVVSPPFRALSDAEEADFARRLAAAGARIVFVGLGCPRQERWMARNTHRVNAVLLGVGAAFDFHAGTMRQAPKWMQNAGLEWLHRLSQEPGRLWRRYVVHNPRFVVLLAAQLLGDVFGGRRREPKA